MGHYGKGIIKIIAIYIKQIINRSQWFVGNNKLVNNNSRLASFALGVEDPSCNKSPQQMRLVAMCRPCTVYTLLPISFLKSITACCQSIETSCLYLIFPIVVAFNFSFVCSEGDLRLALLISFWVLLLKKFRKWCFSLRYFWDLTASDSALVDRLCFCQSDLMLRCPAGDSASVDLLCFC